MLKRLWHVVSAPWSILCIYSGTTREHGIAAVDIFLAAAPWLIGCLLWISGRYILTGSFRRPEKG